ncbi:MAG: metal ABC transporter permease, partial [Cellulosilyticaceae bacterium]
GVAMGFTYPTWGMLVFALLLGGCITYFSYKYPQNTDTVIGVFSALAIALGTMLLSKGGNFNQYTHYLIGDLLSIDSQDLMLLVLAGIVLVAVWYLLFNALLLTSLNISLANSRQIHTFIIQFVFTILVAVVVVLCIPWIGVLLINAFLVLPGAISRHLARNIGEYQRYAIGVALVAGILGLATAYYLGTSAGATIVVWLGGFYILSALGMHFIKR